jgi:hypothetical protein
LTAGLAVFSSQVLDPGKISAAFLVICAAGIGLVYVSISYGKYIVDSRWHDTAVLQVVASGDAATMRQMYYDILVRETPLPPPVLPHRWAIPFMTH